MKNLLLEEAQKNMSDKVNSVQEAVSSGCTLTYKQLQIKRAVAAVDVLKSVLKSL